MEKLKLTLALATLMALPQTSFAAFITGNDLFEMCQNDQDFSDGYCIGYIAGVVDVASDEIVMKDSLLVCLPEHVTMRQAFGVVYLYLEQHPEQRHFSAHTTAMAALIDGFPCD